MSGKYALFALALCVLPALAAERAPLTVGDRVDLSALADQDGRPFSHQDDMRLLIFVGGMDAKDLAREALADVDRQCLAAGRLVYAADISGMPGFIANRVAIPKMREYGYPVWLDRQGDTTANLPVTDGAVAVMTVAQGTITAVAQVTAVDDLVRRFAEACAGE